MQIRILEPGRGDEAALERLLVQHRDSSMFLRSNARAAGLVDRGEPLQGTWAGAFEGSELVAVVAHCWNGTVLLQAPRELPRLLAAALKASKRGLRGFAGPYTQVREARACLDVPGKVLHEERELLLALELTALRTPLAPGCCRHSREEDLELLASWREAYLVETSLEQPGPLLRPAASASVQASHAGQQSYVLELEGELVATSIFNAALPDAVQVGGVYTPPALRGRGHAQRVVAGSLLDARSRGAARAVLFTAQSNTPALSAYRALGFELVGDYGLLLFR